MAQQSFDYREVALKHQLLGFIVFIHSLQQSIEVLLSFAMRFGPENSTPS